MCPLTSISGAPVVCLYCLLFLLVLVLCARLLFLVLWTLYLKNWRNNLRHRMIFFSIKDYNSFLQDPHNPVTGFRWGKAGLCPYKGLFTSGSPYSYGSLYPFRFLMAKSWGILPSTTGKQALYSRLSHPVLARLSVVLLKLLALIHLFWTEQMSPGLFLPCTGWWPSISSLPCYLSNAFSQTFVYICPDFLVVLNEKIGLYYLVQHYWKWQIS